MTGLIGGKPLSAQGFGGFWDLQWPLHSVPRPKRPPFTDHLPQVGGFLSTILIAFHNNP